MQGNMDRRQFGQGPKRKGTILADWSKGSNFFLAALSGGLILCSFPPYGPGGLAFVAFLPLLIAVSRSRSPLMAISLGLVAGLAHFLPGVSWIGYVTGPGWFLLAVYCALFYGFFAGVVWLARQSSSGPLLAWLAVAGFWVWQEYLRANLLLTGFPWFVLGHSQRGFDWFIQTADLWGSHGLSAIVLLVNLFGFEVWSRTAAERKWFAGWRWLTPVLAGLLLCCLYGAVRAASVPTQDSLRVALVQASIPQQLKELDTPTFRPETVLQRYLELTRSLDSGQPVDLIVWPETVVLPPYLLNVDPEALSPFWAMHTLIMRRELRQLAARTDSHLLAGAVSHIPAHYGFVTDMDQVPESDQTLNFNSAYLLDPRGQNRGRHDKVHLVPFGEYIPLLKWFPFLQKLVPFTVWLTPGEAAPVFPIPSRVSGSEPVRLGVLICYEDMFAGLARDLRLRGANILVNISNDAWFETSGELDQHFSVARFRAIENRVGLIRLGNNGISGLIDPLGRVSQYLEDQVEGVPRRKDAVGTLVGTVRTSTERSPYTYWGDGPVLTLSFLAMLVWVFRCRGRNFGFHKQ